MNTIDKTMLCQAVGGQIAAAASAGHPSQVEVMAIAAGLGGGYGAHVAIEAAGGLAAMGTGAIAAGSAMAGGIAAAGYAGWDVGTALYDNVEFVRDGAQGIVEYGAGFGQGASNYYEGIGAHSCTYAPGTSDLEMSDYTSFP
jgi:hypothetical protein